MLYINYKGIHKSLILFLPQTKQPIVSKLSKRCNMKRKIISILVVLLTFTVLFCLTACTQEEQTPEYIEGAFYSLQEAYDNGWITEENLQSIADLYHNKQTAPEIDISEAVSYSIRKTFADERNTPIDIDDVFYAYYGEYNSCIAVMMFSSTEEFPDVMTDVTVGGVTIHYTNLNKIYIWKIN